MDENLRLTIWNKRWESTKELIGILKKKAATIGADNYRTKEKIITMLEHLEAFADAHYTFFRDGFDSNNVSYEFEPHYFDNAKEQKFGKFPLEYVLRQVIQRVYDDIVRIEDVIQQRILHATTPANLVLTTADRLAKNALLLAKETGLVDENLTVLTYFSKGASVRVIPYTSLCLVAVPFTAVDNPEDYLAIPHEIGHYVYNRAYPHRDTPLGTELRDVFPQNVKYLDNWKEELFADIYGCLVGGTAMAIDFQNMQFERSEKEFIADNGKHPVPYLRPYVYLATLKAKGYVEEAKALEKIWESTLDEAYPPETTKRPLEFLTKTGSKAKIDIAKQRIEAVVSKIYNKYFASSIISPWTTNSENPITDFGNYVNGIGTKDVSTQLPEPTAWAAWAKSVINRIDTSQPDMKHVKAGRSAIDAVLEKSKIDGTKKIVKEFWTVLLKGRGWTTEGPHGQIDDDG